LAEATDSSFPANNTVSIVNNEIVIKKAKANQKLDKIKKIDHLITERLPPSSILDVIVDVEKWLNLSRGFKPLSGNEPKRDTVKERFITTTFCYGCNLGPTQTERALKLFDRKQIADFNRMCMSEESVEEAITEVINTYHKLDLPTYFGDGKSASVDGTMWDIYEQNLLAEYHIRYGGYGGIGYYHVSDKYIALFSRFIPCGVYEAIYILDGLLENKSDIQPTKIHGDTQSQNTPVFGLSYLLGIDLMPRIRHLKSLTFYRPTKKSKFQHIDSLFGDAINWELIQTHLADMLRVALSIKAGKISASTILRRLGTYSRKNKLYFAFRELGRAIRTLFLLKYISDPEVRSVIQAATCKSEEFNAFVQWAMFGNQGIIADNLRTQQSKIIKYNHLVANMVILHNAVNMTRVIDQLIAEGVDITPEIISQLSPYRTEHINRFGIYLLDLEKITLPLQLDLKLLFKEAFPETKSKKKETLVSAL
jgi:TnpA family transposase